MPIPSPHRATWAEIRAALQAAELSWLATAGADGRPRVAAVTATWTEGALWFAAAAEQMPAEPRNVVLATARNQGASGLDVVVSGEAAQVTGNTRVAAMLGASGEAAVFEVTPGTVLAYSGNAAQSRDAAWAPVAVSRRIAAPAHAIFQVLADPRRHTELDGSGMLRGAATADIVSAVGDVFVMKMHYSALGDYEMNNHVVDYEPDRYIGWRPEAGRGHPDAAADGARWGHQWGYELAPDGPDATVVTEVYDCSRAPADQREGLDHGKAWLGAMTKTLERLDQICTNRADA
jgi:hypothetical protein